MNVDVPISKNIIRRKRLKHKIGLCDASIYNKLNPSSKYYDDTFPKQIRLGPGSVGWLESEVDAWLNSRLAAR